MILSPCALPWLLAKRIVAQDQFSVTMKGNQVNLNTMNYRNKLVANVFLFCTPKSPLMRSAPSYSKFQNVKTI